MEAHIMSNVLDLQKLAGKNKDASEKASLYMGTTA